MSNCLVNHVVLGEAALSPVSSQNDHDGGLEHAVFADPAVTPDRPRRPCRRETGMGEKVGWQQGSEQGDDGGGTRDHIIPERTDGMGRALLNDRLELRNRDKVSVLSTEAARFDSDLGAGGRVVDCRAELRCSGQQLLRGVSCVNWYM